MRQFLKCFFLAVVALMAVPDEGFACSCLGPRIEDRQAYQQWFQQRTVVFRGTVTANELMPEFRFRNTALRFRKVTFTIDRQWKGVSASTITIFTQSEGSMCGVDYRVGSRDLVAADRVPALNADLSPSETLELRTNICTGSLWWRDQKAFLDAFGEGRPPN